MKPVVVRNIKRADPNAIGTLAAVGVATAHEALGRSGLMKPYMRPIWAGAAIGGPAVTVLAQPGDNWMIHVAVEQCKKGDVLVVGCTADNTDGMFGELLATALVARGVIGLVIDAGCRDVKPLKEMGFPVWSKAISAKGTVKATLGAVNIPVVCGGVNVEPGDVVVADDDGVVVIPKKLAVETAQKAQKRKDDEDGKRKQLEAGVLSPRHVQDARGPGEGGLALRRQSGGRLSGRRRRRTEFEHCDHAEHEQQDQHHALSDGELGILRLGERRPDLWRVRVEDRDFLEGLHDQHEGVEPQHGNRAHHINPAPRAGEMPAIVSQQRDRQNDERDDTDAKRRRKTIDGKQETGDAGEDRGDEKQRGHAGHALRAQHADEHDEAGHDRDQADDDVQHGERMKRHAENHDATPSHPILAPHVNLR